MAAASAAILAAAGFGEVAPTFSVYAKILAFPLLALAVILLLLAFFHRSRRY